MPVYFFLIEINLCSLCCLKQSSEVSISRIRDEDFETEEELFQFSNGHGETSHDNPKVPR